MPTENIYPHIPYAYVNMELAEVLVLAAHAIRALTYSASWSALLRLMLANPEEHGDPSPHPYEYHSFVRVKGWAATLCTDFRTMFLRTHDLSRVGDATSMLHVADFGALLRDREPLAELVMRVKTHQDLFTRMSNGEPFSISHGIFLPLRAMTASLTLCVAIESLLKPNISVMDALAKGEPRDAPTILVHATMASVVCSALFAALYPYDAPVFRREVYAPVGRRDVAVDDGLRYLLERHEWLTESRPL